MARSATTVFSSAVTGVERRITELYELTLPTSAIYYFSNYDVDVQSHAQLGGQTWTSIPIQREQARFRADLGVDDMRVSLANVSITFGGSSTALSVLAMRGILDGAAVKIWLADLTDPASGQRYYHSDWKVQGAAADRGTVEFTLESPLAELNTLTPRRSWAEQCQWSLFSTWCTLVRSQWTVYGRVGSGTTTDHVQFNPSSYGSQVPTTIPGSWFELGQIIFTSGPLNGLRRTINVQSASVASGAVGGFDMLTSLPVAPNSGDSINMVPGCNKSLDHCANKFNNWNNFGGMPFIPRPETQIGV